MCSRSLHGLLGTPGLVMSLSDNDNDNDDMTHVNVVEPAVDHNRNTSSDLHCSTSSSSSSSGSSGDNTSDNDESSDGSHGQATVNDDNEVTELDVIESAENTYARALLYFV